MTLATVVGLVCAAVVHGFGHYELELVPSGGAWFVFNDTQVRQLRLLA